MMNLLKSNKLLEEMTGDSEFKMVAKSACPQQVEASSSDYAYRWLSLTRRANGAQDCHMLAYDSLYFKIFFGGCESDYICHTSFNVLDGLLNGVPSKLRA